MPERVIFLLGSNVGRRENLLAEACAALQSIAPDGTLQCSSVYETEAWGLEDQAAFLNMAIGLETELSPPEILEAIRSIEARMGRQRLIPWGPRTLDVDVLLIGDKIIHTNELQVPHPRLAERRFALTPLAEIAGSWRHPVLGRSMEELLAICPDPLEVRRLGPLDSLLVRADT